MAQRGRLDIAIKCDHFHHFDVGWWEVKDGHLSLRMLILDRFNYSLMAQRRQIEMPVAIIIQMYGSEPTTSTRTARG